jgi:hypothetical protein
MRKSLFIAVAIIGTSLTALTAAKPKNDYIDRFSPIAIQEKNLYNIPASISMAQGILESSWGEGKLAIHNNHFGIKCCGTWQGASVSSFDDDRNREGKLIESCFRAYETAEESWHDHSMFLQQPRYQSLYNYSTNYRAWAIGLQTAGYATDSLYAKKLIRIIETYELYRLDDLNAAIPAFEVPIIEEIIIPEAIVVVIQPISVQENIPTDNNEETLFEITPENEIALNTYTEEEIDVPKVERIPENYTRGQGKKL